MFVGCLLLKPGSGEGEGEGLELEELLVWGGVSISTLTISSSLSLFSNFNKSNSLILILDFKTSLDSNKLFNSNSKLIKFCLDCDREEDNSEFVLSDNGLKVVEFGEEVRVLVRLPSTKSIEVSKEIRGRSRWGEKREGRNEPF